MRFARSGCVSRSRSSSAAIGSSSTTRSIWAPSSPCAVMVMFAPSTSAEHQWKADRSSAAYLSGRTSYRSVPPPPLGGSLLTAADGSGEAVDGLRGYRLAVAGQARRFKRYPAQALASGWEGSVDVRLEVGGDGRAHGATLSRSSGYELLDRAALAMIDAGAERARVPESLRGRAFAIVLPVVFNLGDE